MRKDIDHSVVRDMRASGLTYQAIADHFRCSFSLIYSLARNVHCPVNHKSHASARRGTSLVHSDCRVKEILALRGKMTAAEIADKYGLASRSVVIGLWYRARQNGQIAPDLLQPPRRVRA